MKLAFVMALPIFHLQFALSMHIAIFKVAYVGLPIFPRHCPFPVLKSIFESAPILASIWEYFPSLAVWRIVFPVPLVTDIVVAVDELSFAFKFMILNAALVE